MKTIPKLLRLGLMLTISSATLALSHGAEAYSYKFDKDDLSPNFRPIAGTTPLALNLTAGRLQGSDGNNGHQALIFRPGKKPLKLTDFTLEADVGVDTSGAGFGVYFGGGAESEKLWCFVQASTAEERVRFFVGRNAGQGGQGGAAVADVGKKSAITTNRWFHVEFSAAVVSTSQIDLSLRLWDNDLQAKTAPALELRQSLQNLGPADTKPGEVGISIFRNSATGTANVYVDNLSLTAGAPSRKPN